MQNFLEVVKISRPGFWPTHVWFYLLPFARQDMFATPAFWVGATYVCFPLGLLLYGWNDIGDARTDAINPRKGTWLFGAKPDATMRRRLPAIIASVQLPFLILFVSIAGWKMVGWFAAVVTANAAYNSFHLKSVPGLDLLNQVGYLLVFVLASWLCDVEQLNWAAMVFSGLFAMQSHLFGQIMDHDQDGSAGRRSTAVAIGVVPSKFLLSTMMAIEALIAWCFFSGPVVALFMASGAVFFLIDAIAGPKRYPLMFLMAFFVGWNAICISTMYFIWRDGLFQLSY